MIFLSGNSSVSQHQAFEKYYLTINKKAVFIGELFPHDDETLVNHKVIPPGLGKFKIKTVFASRILAWQKYDPDIHCRDSFIIWSKLETRKTRQHEILKPNVA